MKRKLRRLAKRKYYQEIKNNLKIIDKLTAYLETTAKEGHYSAKVHPMRVGSIEYDMHIAFLKWKRLDFRRIPVGALGEYEVLEITW